MGSSAYVIFYYIVFCYFVWGIIFNRDYAMIKILLSIKRFTSPISIPLFFIIITIGLCGYFLLFILGSIFIVTMLSLNKIDNEFR